jgi:hypothetical protein
MEVDMSTQVSSHKTLLTPGRIALLGLLMMTGAFIVDVTTDVTPKAAATELTNSQDQAK